MYAPRFRTILLGLSLTAAILIPVSPAVAAPPPSAPMADPVKGPGEPLLKVAKPAAGEKRYIVGFRSTLGVNQRDEFWDSVGAKPIRSMESLPVAVVNLTSAESKALKRRPEVKYVEPDEQVRITTTETSPPWGLDRIDGTSPTLDDSYTYYATGSGVDAYVIDTGIAYTHTEFRGRVKPGAYAVDDGYGTWDCDGHGTHVSGTIGGTKYGVAKKVSLIPVRVLDCEGSGWNSWIIAGMDWVVRNHVAGKPAVANMSLGGDVSTAENDAVQRMIADGITVAVSAGNNYGSNACNRSPASAPNALTVGSTDDDDFASDFSNLGPCVDLFAPGRDIRSAFGGGSDYQYLSGTSMATPHVAGVAALILSKHRSWKPATVSARLLAMARPNTVLGDVEEYGTTNKLLSIAPRVGKVSPNTGATKGKQTVTVTGAALYDVTKVTFGGKSGSKLSSKSGSKLTVRTPKHKGTQTVSVRVYSAYSRSGTAVKYIFEKAPSISSISPALGSKKGGQRVTIKGSRFHNVTKVLFGKRAGTALKVTSAGQLSVTAPANSGKQYVRVVAAAGTSSKSKRFRFSYGDVPTVTSISPNAGWVEGGTVVTVTGKGFKSATAVKVGGVVARWTATSDQKLTVTTPAHAAGRVPIVVANKYGGSPAVAGSLFAYKAHPLPVITSVAPNTGPTAGGNTVKITGTNFIGMKAVTFGGVPATITSTANGLTVTVPAHAAGTVDVRVTGQYGTSPVVAADRYTYVDPTPPPPPPPPAPSVQVHAGGRYNTATCTSTRCHWVVVQTASFSGNVECSVVDSDYGAFGAKWVQGANETKQSPNYFGGYRIVVSCNGVTGSNGSWPS